MVRGRGMAVTAVALTYQCALMTSTARGLGTASPNAPWPKNAAGMRPLPRAVSDVVMVPLPSPVRAADTLPPRRSAVPRAWPFSGRREQVHATSVGRERHGIALPELADGAAAVAQRLDDPHRPHGVLRRERPLEGRGGVRPRPGGPRGLEHPADRHDHDQGAEERTDVDDTDRAAEPTRRVGGTCDVERRHRD